MAEWRVARYWTETELRDRLNALGGARRNFNPDSAGPGAPPWRRYASRARIARGEKGPPAPDGPFLRARNALATYSFSDPDIVQAYFDPEAALEGRRQLLELKVPLLRYLCGVVVTRVRDESTAESTTFGFRYDTLDGHIEKGWEWFLINKRHDTGVVTFHVAATWLPGDFPNWWSRVGFHLVGPAYQRRWHRIAHARMFAFAAGAPMGVRLSRRSIVHQGPAVVFTKGETVDAALQAVRQARDQ